MDNKIRCKARFIPQAWIDDYVVEIDGQKYFDITDQIIAMGKEKSLLIRDDSIASDSLAEKAGLLKDHNGPFNVECEENIKDFWSA